MPPSRQLLLAAALAAMLAFPAVASPLERQPAPAAAAATRTVKVADDRYSPKRLEVAKGTRIRWVWSSDNAHLHDVYVYKRPNGSRRFKSPPGTTSFRFARKLRKPGVYKILCTFHEGMRMRIDVSPSGRVGRR